MSLAKFNNLIVKTLNPYEHEIPTFLPSQFAGGLTIFIL